MMTKREEAMKKIEKDIEEKNKIEKKVKESEK